VDQLNSMIQQGLIMEAMQEFYADDVVMAENDAPPTVGLAANLEREQAFVDNTTWYGLELQDVAVGDDVSAVRWWMDFHNAQYGARMAFTQVAVQRWRDGKIVDERFYYTPQPVEAA
jgi:ketosteroid isomerase-like protein